MPTCPCGSEKLFSGCCERFITGQAFPTTPEELMRSRYTAYTVANVDYIQQTMKSPAADNFDSIAAREWAARVQWLKLEVLNASADGDKGIVEFIAHFSDANKKHILHEISVFHRENNRWFYVDGNAPRILTPFATTRVGRNDACLCGSGKKYKKCCGNVSSLGI